MSKTFKETLNEINDNEILYVGTKNGSGWIVIETAGVIIENVEKLEKLLRNKVERINRDSNTRVKNLPYRIVSLRDELENIDPKNVKGKGKIETQLFDLESKFVNAFLRRKETSKRLATWKHLNDRAVVETYPHETDVLGTCIVLEGSDDGDLWYQGEKKSII